MKLLSCTMHRCSFAFLYPFQWISIFVKIVNGSAFSVIVAGVVSWSFLSPGPKTLQATHEIWGVYHPKHGADQHGQPSLVSELPLLLLVFSLFSIFTSFVTMLCLCSASHSLLTSTRVIFRGILSHLCPLYEHLLVLLKEVASSQPMPYLRGAVLPECVADFLGPFDALTLNMTAPPASPCGKVQQPLQRKMHVIVKTKSRKQEDLGITVERGLEFNSYFWFCLLQYSWIITLHSCAIIHYFCNQLVSLRLPFTPLTEWKWGVIFGI